MREFWRFDPDRTSIPQGLEGWRLAGTSYERVRETKQEVDVSCHQSLVLELDLRAEGQLLRFRNPLTGRPLMTYSQECQARKDAERKADCAQRWPRPRQQHGAMPSAGPTTPSANGTKRIDESLN